MYWKEKTGFRNNGLTEIYTTIYEFSIQYYPGNSLIPELIALDYYMQHKVKPGTRFLPEISKEERNEIIDKLKLNHHKYRYVIHTVHFSLQKLLNYGIIEPSTDQLIIEYTGVNTPRVLLQKQPTGV
jgi:hypothetical protein